ncbi:MAG: Gfo/Idh/MocA family oxidoreductase [Verrucomicrobia bacterium]|nr:Gfo/Idh/MocA family oxidoreductase [Verrucomicrobiota bacterium]
MPRLTRRHFLQTAAAAGAWSLMPGCATTARRPRRIAPNEKLQHACIGVGGMGANDLKNFLSHPRCQIVALCDVDRGNLEKAAALVPGARRYTDWREMFAKEGDQVDSVNVSVPDHMHAAIALPAMRAAKHVYCQKPLCHDVAECRAVASTAKETGVITQLGTQFASGAGDRQAVQWLREGAIGKVRRVILCSNREGAVERYRLAGPRPAEPVRAPDALAWDLWLGTAPVRPYAPKIYHPQLWRSWLDFGTGWSGDIGCHIFDAVWKGLGLTAPLSVTADVQKSWRDSPARRADTWPQMNHITWVFPGNTLTAGPELTVEWYDGDKFPPEEAQALARADGFKTYPGEAAIVLGTEGALLLPHTSGARLLPREKFASHARTNFEPRNHYHHFVDGCISGQQPESHFGQTGPMAEAIILGTVAVRTPDTTLRWDAARARVTNSPEANQLLRRTYRTGWEVAGV